MPIQASLKTTSYLFLLCAMSCTWDQVSQDFDCSLDPVQVDLLESSDSDCSTPTGEFTIEAIGGELPYTFESELGTNTDGFFKNVGAGSYTVVVTDVNGCLSEIVVEILNEDGVNLDNILTTDAGCKSPEGSIEIVASGGIEPYFYNIDDGDSQASNTFTELNGGTYTIGVEDQEGCKITRSVRLSSGVSFNSIETIIKNRCTSCHGSSTSPSFGSYEAIKSHADRIMARTSAGTMPPSGGLPQSEIDAIACWVNDGALSN